MQEIGDSIVVFDPTPRQYAGALLGVFGGIFIVAAIGIELFQLGIALAK